jgi:hypothetical protein
MRDALVTARSLPGVIPRPPAAFDTRPGQREPTTGGAAMNPHVQVTEIEPTTAGMDRPPHRPGERFAPDHVEVRRRLRGRLMDTLVQSVLCFATIHMLILVTHAFVHRDPASLNLFLVLDAHRLWPSLGSTAAQGWSFAFGSLVLATVFALLGRRHTDVQRMQVSPVRNGSADGAKPASTAAPVSARGGVMTNGHSKGRLPLAGLASAPSPRLSPAAGWLALVGGLTLHMAALASVDRLVPAFPSVPDLLHVPLPYVDFGVPGELAYAVFMLAMGFVLFRKQPHTVPAILTLLGLFYAVRGVFLFLLPIGMPPTAPPLSERFVLWPFPGHAYFPGGHTGMMTVLSLSVLSRPWRRAFLVATFVFAVGTLLARTHYSADAFGGWLVGYAIVLWGRQHLGSLGSGPAVTHRTVRIAAVRAAGEV